MRSLIDPNDACISVAQQCELLGLPRSSYYYHPQAESEENLVLMELLDKQYLRTPFYGVRKMRCHLQEEGYPVNPKRVRRLLRKMGIEAIYPRPRTSKPGVGHQVYPYLLREMLIDQPNQVWAADITYIPMKKGFMYLAAVIDWHSRYVLAWELSNTMSVEFCLDVLAEALTQGQPLIFNTDQGAQFTSDAFTAQLLGAGVKISMDGKGRALDNVFIERLWRSVKYEDIYLRSYEDGWALRDGLDRYFHFYNHQRYHQHLDNQRPAEVYGGRN